MERKGSNGTIKEERMKKKGRSNESKEMGEKEKSKQTSKNCMT